MKSNKCNTINLAKVSLDTLKKRTSKLQKIPEEKSGASFNQCIPHYMPPPPRPVRSAKIQICRPQAVDWSPPPVPCICPPCPVCPTRGEQLANLTKLALKIGVAYFLYEATKNKGFWGPPDGTSRIMTNLSNSIMKLVSSDPKGHKVYGGDRISFLETDRFRFKLLTWWDKAVVTFFTWTIGMPLQYAHDVYEKIESTLFPEEEDPSCREKHGHGLEHGHGGDGKANGKEQEDKPEGKSSPNSSQTKKTNT